MARTGSSGWAALLTLAVGFSRHRGSTGEDSHRVLGGCPESGCLDSWLQCLQQSQDPSWTL